MTDNNATLEQIIIDMSLREFCFISDIANPKYISWNNTEDFMNMWRKCQEIKDQVDILYTFRIKDK
jgi:hypothetical protein